MASSISVTTWFRGVSRNSPWFVIAASIHIIAFALLSVIYVTRHFQTQDVPPTAIAMATPSAASVEAAAAPLLEVLNRQAIPENTEVELIPFDELAFQPIVLSDEPQDLHLPRGDPLALSSLPAGGTGGTAIGAGEGPGRRGTGVPGHVTLHPGGGGETGRSGPTTRATEAGVLAGMRWLMRHQAEDGSWPVESLRERCSVVGGQCIDEGVDFSPEYTPGLTALSLLTFLGAGYGHDSKASVVDEALGERHVVGEVVKAGLKWLAGEQGPDGAFTNFPGSMYNEALGALALSEAYGLTHARYWKEPAERAIRYLVAGQKDNPTGSGRWGWRYQPGGDSIADTSVTCWVVMALKSARNAGLTVPQECMDGSLAFARWVTGKDGQVGYLDPLAAGAKVSGRNEQFDYHPGTMSSLGMLIRTFVAHDITDPFLEQAARYIVKDLPAVSADRLSIDYYYWYYASLALNQFDGPDSPRKGGTYWDPWNKAMTRAILDLQDKDEERDVCTRGGWLAGDRWSYAGGPIYATAINVLTLEVYYRYANAFGAK